jgi:hypothetical protein
MENVSCNVIYVDRSVSQDRSVKASDERSDKDAFQWESARIAENVQILLGVFDEGMGASDPSIFLNGDPAWIY